MGTSRLIHRRSLLIGLGASLAAPAIVRASSLMPIKALAPDLVWIAPNFNVGDTVLVSSVDFTEFRSIPEFVCFEYHTIKAVDHATGRLEFEDSYINSHNTGPLELT
jgi:hypothetical protein